MTVVVESVVGGNVVDGRRDELRSTGRKIELVLVEVGDCWVGRKLAGPEGSSRVESFECTKSKYVPLYVHCIFENSGTMSTKLCNMSTRSK